MMSQNDLTVTQHVLPALPGYSLAIYHKKEDEISYEPLIGWAIATHVYEHGTFHQRTPLSADPETDVASLGNDWAIKCPSGQFFFDDCWSITSEEKALAHFKQRAARDREIEEHIKQRKAQEKEKKMEEAKAGA